jgi:hypothetical protein
MIKEKNKMRIKFANKFKKHRKNMVYKLPDKGMKEETIIKRMCEGRDYTDAITNNGAKISGCLYINDEEHWDFLSDVMRIHIASNPLHVDEYFHIG